MTGPAADPVPDATVTGAPADVLRWLWNREDASTEVQVAGDADAITRLKRCLVVATQ